MALYLGGRFRIDGHAAPRRAEAYLGVGLPLDAPATLRPVDRFLDIGVVLGVCRDRALAPAPAARAERTIEMIAAFGDRFDASGWHALRRHAVRRRRARTERMW